MAQTLASCLLKQSLYFCSPFLTGAEGILLDSTFKPQPSDKAGLGAGFITCVAFASPSHPPPGAP